MKSTMIVLMLLSGPGLAPAGAPVFRPGQSAPRAPQAADAAAPVRVISMRGDVTVRHGASEAWVGVAAGDALKPGDSMRLGGGASAVLDAGGRRIALPAMVIVDVADLRDITRGDLLLKLAMEDVRSAPRSDPKLDAPGNARTTTTRAGDRDGGSARTATAGPVNALRLGGTEVLYDNGFYGTCVLRSKEIFRVEPSLAGRIDARFRVADALEKMRLGDEAYEAYAALASEELSPEQRKLVEGKLEALKR